MSTSRCECEAALSEMEKPMPNARFLMLLSLLGLVAIVSLAGGEPSASLPTSSGADLAPEGGGIDPGDPKT